MAKILLVEDDNNLREIYEARLEAEGYEIVSARDGEEALTIAIKEKPDLIISDVMMPKISGFDMLDILRSTEETKHTKIIMMTALSQAEDKARAEKLGADRYLVKSQVTLEDVARVAREVLSGEAPPPVATAAPAQPVTPAVAPAPVVPTPITSMPTDTDEQMTTDSTQADIASTVSQAIPAAPPDPTPAPAQEPIATTVDPTPAPMPISQPTDATGTAVPTDVTPVAVVDIAAPVADQSAVSTSVPETTTTPETIGGMAPVVPENPVPVQSAATIPNPTPADSPQGEEDAIAQQIEDFIASNQATTETPPPTASAPSTEQSTPPIPPTEPPPAAENQLPKAEARVGEPTETAVSDTRPRKKVIQPLNDLSKPMGPDLLKMAEAEEAQSTITQVVTAVVEKKADAADEAIAESILRSAAHQKTTSTGSPDSTAATDDEVKILPDGTFVPTKSSDEELSPDVPLPPTTPHPFAAGAPIPPAAASTIPPTDNASQPTNAQTVTAQSSTPPTAATPSPPAATRAEQTPLTTAPPSTTTPPNVVPAPAAPLDPSAIAL